MCRRKRVFHIHNQRFFYAIISPKSRFSKPYFRAYYAG